MYNGGTCIFISHLPALMTRKVLYFLIQVIIEAVRGINYRGDIAIDEVGFIKGVCGQGSSTRAKQL